MLSAGASTNSAPRSVSSIVPVATRAVMNPRQRRAKAESALSSAASGSPANDGAASISMAAAGAVIGAAIQAAVGAGQRVGARQVHRADRAAHHVLRRREGLGLPRGGA